MREVRYWEVLGYRENGGPLTDMGKLNSGLEGAKGGQFHFIHVMSEDRGHLSGDVWQAVSNPGLGLGREIGLERRCHLLSHDA